jgi:hypothetical protein
MLNVFRVGRVGSSVKPLVSNDMAKKRVKFGQCVYCYRFGQITRDHIPPKNLFAHPRPNNLITVPCCFKCNDVAGKDDEYFRLMISMREDVAQHPEALRILPDVIRSLHKPEKDRLMRRVLQSVESTPFYTWSGLYASNFLSYDVSLERLSKTVARITKGLFYHETGQVLPETHAVMAATEPFANTDDPDDLERRAAKVLNAKPKCIGEGVFSYRVHFIEGSPNNSQWYFEFFGAVPFLSLTIEEDAIGTVCTTGIVMIPFRKNIGSKLKSLRA